MAHPGHASVDLEDRSLPGAERVLAFRIDSWTAQPAALPLAAQGPVEYSPYNPRCSLQWVGVFVPLCLGLLLNEHNGHHRLL